MTGLGGQPANGDSGGRGFGGWQWAPGSFMARLAPQTQGALLGLGARRRFRSGQPLLREGEHSDHILVLLHGVVKVTAIAEDTDALLSIRVAGDVVGETAGLTGRPRTATVMASGEVYASAVTRLSFERFVERYPEAAVQLAAMISERLRWANLRRVDFAAYPAEVRLCRLLADLAEQCGRRVETGTLIDVPLSQRELATMIGVSDATIQNAIRDLKRLGLIATGYRRTIVTDLTAIRKMGAA